MAIPKEESRKLVAVLFADIEGFTALMQKNEKQAMEWLDKYQRVLQQEVRKQNGQIIKNYGDGSLCTFPTALSAIQSAKDFQLRMRKDLLVPVRIGLHVGDVIFKDQDAYGDTINLSSRIESAGLSGSVLMSDTFYRKVKNQSSFSFQSIGAVRFKNVEQPIELFALSNEYLVVPRSSQLSGKVIHSKINFKKILGLVFTVWLIIQSAGLLISSNNMDEGLLDLLSIAGFFAITGYTLHQLFKKSRMLLIPIQVLNVLFAVGVFSYYMINPLRIQASQTKFLHLMNTDKSNSIDYESSLAVLPFSVFTEEDQNLALFSGMHDALIHEINHIKSIRIPSRTSTVPYTQTDKSLRQIARELGVQSIMESSVSKTDSTIQLRFNLIDVFPEEITLWSSTYNTSVDDLPKLLPDIVKQIANNLEVEISSEEQQLLSSSYRGAPGAYESFLMGQYYAGFLTPEAIELASSYFLRSIEIDPNFPLGLGGLSMVWVTKKQMGYVSTEEANPKIKYYLEKSLKMDSLNSESWIGVGAVGMWTDFDWKLGEYGFKRSIELNPNSAAARTGYGHALLILNRFEDARAQIEYAELLDPLNPWVLSFSGAMNFYMGRMFTAAKRFEKLRQLEPNHPMLNQYLLNKYASSFQYESAIEELKKMIYLPDDHSIFQIIDQEFSLNGFKPALIKAVESLEIISNEIFIAPNVILRIYELIDDNEKEIEWLQVMLEVKDPFFPYYGIKTGDPIQQDPRYIRMMEDVGLW
jgi:class 3 adenylate cyclase/TolB-like protein